MATASQNTMTFQNKIFIQIEKDNAHMMFGYRILFKQGVRAPYIDRSKSNQFKYEPNGFSELKAVA
jgi:hypothetical protein